MGLAASATTLPLCECPQMCLVRLSACKDVGPKGVCRDSRSDRCPERFREGQQVGTPCSGFNGNNEPGTGKWTCDFAGGRFFDGASGGSCEGFTVDGLKVKGRLNCD